MSFQQCSRLLIAQGCKKPMQPSSLKMKNNNPTVWTNPASACRNNSTATCNTQNCQHRFLSRKDTQSSSSTSSLHVGIRNQMNGESDAKTCSSTSSSSFSGSRQGSARSLSTFAAATVAGGSSSTPPITSFLWGSLVAAVAVVSSSSLLEKNEDSIVEDKDGSIVSSAMLDTTTNQTTSNPTITISTRKKKKKKKSTYESMESQKSKDTNIVATAAASRRKQPLEISVGAEQGARYSMEDEYIVAEGGRFVAVFDGHGGNGVSKYLKEHLYQSIQRNLKVKHWEEAELVDSHYEENPLQMPSSFQSSSSKYRHHSSTTRTSDDSTSSSQMIAMSSSSQETMVDFLPSLSCQVAALRSSFADMENDVMADRELREQGSTAVAVLLHENSEGHRTLLSANVGDSRAILSTKNRKAIELTRDHKPNDKKEKARILNAGGSIEWDPEGHVHRVNQLSLSRAIGDAWAKPLVTSDVDIEHYPIVTTKDDNENDDENQFILLASDGLWDVMTSNEVVQFVHDNLEKEMNAIPTQAMALVEHQKQVVRTRMARRVAIEAIERGSLDNVCVVIVWLDDWKKNNNGSKQPSTS